MSCWPRARAHTQTPARFTSYDSNLCARSPRVTREPHPAPFQNKSHDQGPFLARPLICSARFLREILSAGDALDVRGVVRRCVARCVREAGFWRTALLLLLPLLSVTRRPAVLRRGEERAHHQHATHRSSSHLTGKEISLPHLPPHPSHHHHHPPRALVDIKPASQPATR